MASTEFIVDDFSVVELKEFKSKKFKDSCCHSYLTPKGRCYTCPEEDYLEIKEDNKDEY